MALYVRLGRALDGFFRAHGGAVCAECLEHFRREHPTHPESRLRMASGLFPGCCQAGIEDGVGLPGGASLPPAAARRLRRWRGRLPRGHALDYALCDPDTGRRVTGKGCRFLSAAGCRQGPVRPPLCLTYVCSALWNDFQRAGDPALLGSVDDFCGCVSAYTSVATAPLPQARTALRQLERRLRRLDQLLSGPGPVGSEKAQ